ncbi:branched-chain amino acid ABC transporter permease [Paraburkholderia tropica]|uniref:branched-chain amino acid ABC transporter permease n=1 Tax=Paraburkholderia tropica TaxID=92647 RepID=UPI002ABD5DE9|nr:branched-chain amino acid ABC transporter permease LivH [Paraburkholderia tropica]
MSEALQQLINGLTLGAIYGLIAIGYTMVYGIIGMINFAHGDIYMVSAFIAVTCFTLLGGSGIASVVASIGITLLVSILLTSVFGWTVERVGYRPLRGSSRLAPLISSIGISIFLQNAVQLTQGSRVKSIQPLVTGGVNFFSTKGQTGAYFSYVQMLIIVVTVILMVSFTQFINRTSFGRQQRACEQDQRMMQFLGYNVDRIIALTFMIGAGLAAVAGVMVTLYYGVIDFSIGFEAGIKAFTAAVLGGIGSIPGAMLGGVIIGLIEAFWAAYLSPEYKDVATFVILIVVLMFRPYGLLGRPEVEKV